MEILEIPGYLLEEKVEIARRHLLPKQLERHGLLGKHLSVAPPVAYLLQMPVLAADERAPLHEEAPILEWWPVCPRPSFDRGGTARSECIVAHWLRGWSGPTVNRPYLRWQRPPLRSTRQAPGEVR
jgi:hypothetical protein